ncbi:hypothetical protein AAVH_28345 [Aphelenchoides avenae]|nr:hypothetical protein AAVH_28345 [Aphelenchus avenae]
MFMFTVVRVWSGLQGVMQRRQGTHLDPHELDRYELLIKKRSMYVGMSLASTADGCDGRSKGTVKRYRAAFEHLMFDRVYLETLRRSARANTNGDYGTEQFHPGQTCLIVPAGLTASQRAQWIQDFTALMAFKDFTALIAYSQKKQLKAAVAPPLGLAHDGPSPPALPSKLDIYRKMNQHMYKKNKELASQNAAMERKVDRTSAFRSLVA